MSRKQTLEKLDYTLLLVFNNAGLTINWIYDDFESRNCNIWRSNDA